MPKGGYRSKSVTKIPKLLIERTEPTLTSARTRHPSLLKFENKTKYPLTARTYNHKASKVRVDKLGTQIKKGCKEHRITFRDQ